MASRFSVSRLWALDFMSDLYRAQASAAGFDPDWTERMLVAHEGRAIMVACDLVMGYQMDTALVARLLESAGPVQLVRLYEACRSTAATGHVEAYTVDTLTADSAIYTAFSDWYFRRYKQVLSRAIGSRSRRPLAERMRDFYQELIGRPLPPTAV